MRTPRNSIGSAPSSRHAQGGFALLITITLLAFLVLLLVSLASLTRVETQVATNNQQLSLARQNAMMALNIALGQLQQAAGPDQRVTARAEILDTLSTTLRNTGSGAMKQPLWTGVWMAQNPNSGANNQLDVGASPTLRTWSTSNPTSNNSRVTWLVSGTSTATAGTAVDNSTINPASWTASTTNSVDLARGLGAANLTVAAPLVKIDAANSTIPGLGSTGTSTVGHYAYWIADEGVKAKVNITDPTLGVTPSSDPSRNQLHFLAPQSVAAHKGLSDFGNNDIRSDTNLPKVLTPQSLLLLANLSALSTLKIVPDITTYGAGLLADVRRGGLRKDLTAVFESPIIFNTFSANNTYGYGKQMLYRTASSEGLVVAAPTTSGAPYYDSVDQSGSNPAVDGVSWFSLYTHYNAYKGVMTASAGLGSGGTAPTSSGNISTAPNIASPRIYSLTGPVRTGTLMPNAIAVRLDIALSSYKDPLTAQWKLRLHYYPQLVLHNPYCVRLSLAGFQFERRMGAFNSAGSYNTSTPTVTCIRIKTTTGGTSTIIPYFLVNQGGRFTLRNKAGDCDTLEPGETRVFALDQDNSSPTTPAAAITFTDLVSNSNMSADYSQQCDVLSAVDSNGISTGPAFSTTDESTIVDVTLATPRLRLQSTDTFALPNTIRWPQSDSLRYMTGGGSSDLSAAAGSWSSIRIDQLTSPRRIIGFYMRQKGLKSSASARSYSNASNNIPLYMGNFAAVSAVDDNFSHIWREIYLSPFGGLYQNSQTDVNISPSGSHWQTSFGDESVGVLSSSTRYVLRDVPTQPLVSLGQFMHMSASRYTNATGDYAAYGTGSMFVGGSCASPAIPTDYNALAQIQGATTGGGLQRTIYTDDSFLANEAIFDRFFFSTVPPQTLNAANTTYPATWTEFNAANTAARLADSSKPLLNSRLKPYAPQGTLPLMADLRDMDKASANLLLDGAFNVNSTSVAAWKAFLGGLSGNDLRLYDATSGISVTESTSAGGKKGVAFARFWSASGKSSANTLWSGLRVLSDNELDDLATKIVAEVKLRGPFLSLADFLNRRLGSNSSALSRCGALQAAIDKTSPDINTAAKSAGVLVNATIPSENPTPYPRAPNLNSGNMKDANGTAWNTALGVPGYLMQQDIVQAIAPAISARSDTFVIRTYGETMNPITGTTEGKAWCEAVVQRLPDYIITKSANASTGNDPQDTPPPGSDNNTFGRRFQIVTFRWLTSNDI